MKKPSVNKIKPNKVRRAITNGFAKLSPAATNTAHRETMTQAFKRFIFLVLKYR
jgi:hypothetical protein